MRNLILTFIITVVLTSCSRDKKRTTIEGKMATIEGWTLETTKGETDTTGVKSWFPTTELTVEFNNKEGSNCLKPTLDFYPIELEQYIEEKLLKHLILRANLFPPPPHIYISNEHIILAWDMVDYDEYTCCSCIELKKELIRKLELKTKSRPEGIQKQILNGE